MEAVIGLLLMLLRVSHGVETYCDGRQDGAQCYGALGGTVVLQLMDSASEISRYQLFKNTTAILSGRKNKIVSNLIADRSSFTPSNGTFRIHDLSWTDGGEYTFTIFDSNGHRSEQRTLQLIIQGVETYCDGRQDGAQCYGALGETVVLQLMDSASEISRYQLFKNKTAILSGRKNKIVINLVADRSSFTPSNGTFRINNLSRTDGGEYTLTIFDSDGLMSEQRTLQLTFQAPVSSVLLVSECLSQGEMRVSCSSEGGDSPQYSWTLDGHTLTDTQLLSGNNETNNITLKQDVSGQLTCSVKNHVSTVSETKTISTCGFIFIDCISNGTRISQWVLEANNTLCIGTTTTPTSTMTPEGHIPIIAGVLSALVILLVVGVAFVCVHLKKQKNKPKEEDDEQELTYADVRIVQRQGRQIQQVAEVDVEYGQVKFSGRPRQTVKQTEDACVYAMVRKGR